MKPYLALLDASLIDPDKEKPFLGGVLIRDKSIIDIGPHITSDNIPSDTEVISCTGLMIGPGLIDMRAFVGEPGFESRERLATVSAAALAGGVTSIVATPDTFPVVDEPGLVEFLLRRAKTEARVRIFPSAAITKNLVGEQLSEIGLLQQAGAIAFTDSYHTIANARVMRRALIYARDFDALVIHFSQDKDLVADGIVSEGAFAARLGLPALPLEAETIVLERDLLLAAYTNARYHALVVSNHLSLAAIKRAKNAGSSVTCGIAIHHLCLSEEEIGEYKTFCKFIPPLRAEAERLQLIEAVRESVIDVIISDHDPHNVEAKRLPFAEAQAGASSVQTLLSAGLMLVQEGRLTLPQLFRACSRRPADILRLPYGRLTPSAPADLVVFDPNIFYILGVNQLYSLGQNSAFEGRRLCGEVKMTLVGGEIVYQRP